MKNYEIGQRANNNYNTLLYLTIHIQELERPIYWHCTHRTCYNMLISAFRLTYLSYLFTEKLDKQPVLTITWLCPHLVVGFDHNCLENKIHGLVNVIESFAQYKQVLILFNHNIMKKEIRDCWM